MYVIVVDNVNCREKFRTRFMDRGLLNQATSPDYEVVPGFTLTCICSMNLELSDTYSFFRNDS